MFDLSKYLSIVPNSLLQDLKPYLLLEFYDYPYLSVDFSPTGTLYLNYYVNSNEDLNVHLLTEISSDKLQLFLLEELQLQEIFHNPESGVVFYGKFDSNGLLSDLSIIDLEFLKISKFVPIEYKLDFEEEIINSPVFDLQLSSVKKGKILVDIYLQAGSLKTSLKLWALKSFFIPFSELLRNSLLNNSYDYTAHNLDKKVNLGINQFAINSLASTIEINYNSDLFGESADLNNISNLFSILNSKEEVELIGNFDKFNNKKIISEYLKILNVIIKNDATLITKVAAPNKYFAESYLSKNEAQNIKNIINEKIPDIEDVEDIRGYLLELNFDKSNPTFSMDASLEELKYRGRIDIELTNVISQKEFVFLSKEYIFTIHTIYRPETSKSPEKITRTLKNIIDYK
jgi:hypothetical protein